MGWEDDLIATLEDEIKKDSTSGLYDEDFYNAHVKYKPIYSFLGDLIVATLEPKSVIDLGCGCGFLLERLKEHGVSTLKGIDGSDQAESDWSEDIKTFAEVHDLVKFKPEGRYDLAVCMEVAEHIPQDKSSRVVKVVTSAASKFVWWTAAVPGQGGTGHVNCQSICYWVREFENQGFVPAWELTYDLKTEMLKIPEICMSFPWFRDNLILFKRVGK